MHWRLESIGVLARGGRNGRVAEHCGRNEARRVRFRLLKGLSKITQWGAMNVGVALLCYNNA
jgi:hypothetical protein